MLLGGEYMLNLVQKSSFSLIQSDARFLYTLTNIQTNASNVDNNYILMALPYVGIFADGARQWCQKIGLWTPEFTNEEEQFYTDLRNGHKLFETTFIQFRDKLRGKFNESNNYFYRNRSLLEKLIGYNNVGADLYNGYFCGNTILCAMYIPIDVFNRGKSSWIRDVSVVAGQLAAYFGCKDFPPYSYRTGEAATYKDYHFFNKSPLKNASFDSFCLFSILCSINYVTKFIEDFFIEEVIQKFKLAYLQYYYLCDLTKSINDHSNYILVMDRSLYSRSFRNCLAHYGLGQFMLENDIISDDPLKGLTMKAFGKDYHSIKKQLYGCLNGLVDQISSIIF